MYEFSIEGEMYEFFLYKGKCIIISMGSQFKQHAVKFNSSFFVL